MDIIIKVMEDQMRAVAGKNFCNSLRTKNYQEFFARYFRCANYDSRPDGCHGRASLSSKGVWTCTTQHSCLRIIEDAAADEAVFLKEMDDEAANGKLSFRTAYTQYSKG